MTGPTGGGARPGDAEERVFRLLCWALVVASLAVQAVGVVHRNVHWDEFIFLARIHGWLRHEPLPLVQTGYVHLFGWLQHVSGTEVGQVVAGRGIVLGLWILALILIHRVARAAGLDGRAALASVALAATLREDLVHAASFRIDGLMAPTFLGALLLALRGGLVRSLAAGALGGVLLVLSIKGVLLLPLLAVALLASPGPSGRRPSVGDAAAAGVSLVAVAALLLAGHATTLAPGIPAAGAPATTGAFVGNAGRRMLLDSGLFPRWDTLLASVRGSAAAWLFLAVGLAGAGAALRRDRSRRGDAVPSQRLLLLVFAAPLLFFAVYRNFFPYAFVGLATTMWITAGAGWSRSLTSRRQAFRWVAWASFAWPGFVLLGQARAVAQDGTRDQRQVLEVVHGLFPDPVSYIDRVGMVSTFPRPLFNMTTFGMETYRARGDTAVARYIAERHPPLLLLNTSSLDVFGAGMVAADPRPRLLPGDSLRVAESYARYWGPVYLAGRRWRRLEPGADTSFHISVPGAYTVLAPGPVRVDGVLRAPGDALRLDQGAHTIAVDTPLGDVRLFWGTGIQEPSAPPPQGSLFQGF